MTETHAYQRCEHPGRHGYTLPGDPAEHEFCERCRRPQGAHPSTRGPLADLTTDALIRWMQDATEDTNLDDETAELDRRMAERGLDWTWKYIGGVGHRIVTEVHHDTECRDHDHGPEACACRCHEDQRAEEVQCPGCGGTQEPIGPSGQCGSCDALDARVDEHGSEAWA